MSAEHLTTPKLVDLNSQDNIKNALEKLNDEKLQLLRSSAS
jgi:hypothetical protein